MDEAPLEVGHTGKREEPAGHVCVDFPVVLADDSCAGDQNRRLSHVGRRRIYISSRSLRRPDPKGSIAILPDGRPIEVSIIVRLRGKGLKASGAVHSDTDDPGTAIKNYRLTIERPQQIDRPGRNALRKCP